MSLKKDNVSKQNRSRLHSSLHFALITFVLYICSIQAQAQCEDDEILAEQKKLIASDTAPLDRFGGSVSVSGDTVIVGSRGDNCTAGFNCGSAYVYRFDGTEWIEKQKLTASDQDEDDFFGYSVSVSGDTAVVGAWTDDCIVSGDKCGSAYVYRFSGTSWVEEQKLTASNAEAGDKFGLSVSVSGDTIVVSAPGKFCSPDNSCGAAYVFRFDGSNWVEEQKLTASDVGFRNRFGISVSVNGNTVVVGVPFDDCSLGGRCGSAYVYQFNGIHWIETQKLIASDATAQDLFGFSVSVFEETAVVGAVLSDCEVGIDCVLAYVFRFNGTSWVEQQKLTTPDAEEFDESETSVSVSGDMIVVGIPLDDCLLGSSCGSAYVYRFSGNHWIEEQKLTASDKAQRNEFGGFVSTNGELIVVGAKGVRCTAGDCGAAYIFSCVSTTPVVNLDIKPGSCPNPVNPRSRGVVSVAIVGSSFFDVMTVDLDSLILARSDGVGGSVSPHSGKRSHRIFIEDVATPFDGELCECHELAGDGIDDLSLKFSTSELNHILELNDLSRGETIELVLRGNLQDGSTFEAVDCITIPGTNRELQELQPTSRND